MLALLLLAISIPDPRVEAAVQRVDAARLHETVARLVSFGTRHTLSDTRNPARGIGAARAWLQAEFARIAQGTRLVAFEDRFLAPIGKRIPAPVEIVNLGVVLPGTDPQRKDDAIVMTAHYDSMPTDVMDPKSDAPGADDDGSGVSMALELARALAREEPRVSFYMVAVAGEEQGLVGSQHLAETLKARNLNVLAMVSVDIAGNTEGTDGNVNSVQARLFSEGTPESETDAQKKLRLAVGSENDSPARELARYLQREGELYSSGLQLRVMLRRDRLARGSDHLSFAHEGFPAVRLSEAVENYRRQHQTPRTENGQRFGDELEHFDALYAARLCKALLGGLFSLSLAPGPPREVALLGAVSPDAHLRWQLPPDAADAVLYQRPADAVSWQSARSLGRVSEIVLPHVNTDDWFFAIASRNAQGDESLPQSPVSTGR